MFTWRSLSAPSKVITLIIAFILIGGTLYLTNRYVYGNITLTTHTPNAFVELEGDDFINNAPFTYRLKPGSYSFTFLATGYLDKTIKTTVFPFWSRTVTVTMNKDVSTDNEFFRIEYHPGMSTYFIVPIIPLNANDSVQNQLSGNWSTYQDHANRAIQYIKDQGVNPRSIPIQWWLREYWPKGKTISY